MSNFKSGNYLIKFRNMDTINFQSVFRECHQFPEQLLFHLKSTVFSSTGLVSVFLILNKLHTLNLQRPVCTESSITS